MVLLRSLVPIFCIFFVSETKKLVIENDDYSGNFFPTKYLQPENFKASMEDLYEYLYALSQTVSYFASNLNFTDVNKSIGLYFMQGILRRTLLENGDKLPEKLKNVIKKLSAMSDEVISHYVYDIVHGPDNLTIHDGLFRVAQIFREKELLIHSLGNITGNRLKRWILSKGKLHEYIKEMDTATLPKEKYVELVDDSYAVYHILIEESDTCLSRIMYNLAPPPTSKTMRQCGPDPHCHKNLHAAPSIAYGLSHRQLNLMVYRYVRHCYWVSPEADEMHIDVLCAFMYREAVYLARRGYFARDLFLEHIALCGLVGYEEFFRRHWFFKAISWMDDQGCIQESRNYIFNRTRRFMGEFPEQEDKEYIRQTLVDALNDECHNHPMSLLVTVLAHAVRYTVHMLPNVV